MQTKKYAFHPLLHSGDLIEEQLRLRLLPLGLGPRQARMLDALDRLGTAAQIDLAKAFNVTAASMSTMTSRLVEAGFITCTQHQHERRSNVLALTDHGTAMLENIHAAWRAMDDVIETAIGKDKAAALATLTLELRNALGGRAPAKPVPAR